MVGCRQPGADGGTVRLSPRTREAAGSLAPTVVSSDCEIRGATGSPMPTAAFEIRGATGSPMPTAAFEDTVGCRQPGTDGGFVQSTRTTRGATGSPMPTAAFEDNTDLRGCRQPGANGGTVRRGGGMVYSKVCWPQRVPVASSALRTSTAAWAVRSRSSMATLRPAANPLGPVPSSLNWSKIEAELASFPDQELVAALRDGADLG